MGEDSMKLSPVITLICICFIFAGLAGSVAVDPAQYDKSVSIHLTIDNGKITAQSTEIYYGSAPNLIPTQEGFKGELVASDGSIVKTFPVPDPRVESGDVIVSDANGPHIQGVIDRQNPADFVVTFPLDPKVTEFRIYNPSEETLLTSVNLKPQINSFFSTYPRDPDNPASAGSRAPVNTIPQPAGSASPLAASSGLALGILTIGSGAMLLLGGGFASVRILRVKSRSVLLVDDNPDIIGVIADMLRLGGYTTRTAPGGRECLDELATGIPDLVLLDIGMEPMDGWETLRLIKKNPATRGIPVIMLTAKPLTPKDVLDYNICIEDYIMKPVTLQDLNDAITRVFDRRRMIQEKIAAAKGASVDRNALCECARLTRVVDVNKRLWDLLVKTYNLNGGIPGPTDELAIAIRNTEQAIRDQENRLEQIRHHLGSGVR
jgi:two-component system, OmpR family, response regulator